MSISTSSGRWPSFPDAIAQQGLLLLGQDLLHPGKHLFGSFWGRPNSRVTRGHLERILAIVRNRPIRGVNSVMYFLGMHAIISGVEKMKQISGQAGGKNKNFLDAH